MRWWRFVVASEVRKILAFRSDFWITFLGQTLIQLLIARALWESIFEASGKEVMEGFTLSSMTLYYLIVPIGSKMLTGENIGFLSREIYDGTFNRYLIYPISFFQYKTLTYLTYSIFYAVQLFLIYVIYMSLNGELNLQTLNQLCLGLCFFLLASFAYLNLSLFVELISLWADNIWSLMVMTRFFCLFFGGGFVPLTFFPQMLQKFLIYTPFPYLIHLPINVTMGLVDGNELLKGGLTLFAWAWVFRGAAMLLWNKGRYHYTGVGI